MKFSKLSNHLSCYLIQYYCIIFIASTQFWKFPVKVPFLVSCCKCLKSVILKTFNEIVLAFLSVESRTNTLYININFTGNLLLGFGRYCSKVLPEAAVIHLFWAPALTNNVFSIFFPCWRVVNKSRNKWVSAFLLYFINFETINFYRFFIKMSLFGSNLFF